MKEILIISAILIAIVGCSLEQSTVSVVDTEKDPPANEESNNSSGGSENLSQNQKIPVTVSLFTTTSKLCDDDQGPSCTKLRLGDDYLTTYKPAKDYLYSCTEGDPNAPGSIESKITWINFADKTWNFLKKLWLPQGTFSPKTGNYTETISGDTRQISANNLPVDGKIGDWPMTNYPTLTEIDQNPGVPASRNFEFSYATNPPEASSPTCVALGVIGVTRNGVVIFNATDGRGEDAVAREIVDVFGGHPAGSEYHYHFIPERMDSEYLSNGHSGIVGYINDGFPIYGYKGDGGVEMSNDDLDQCHGHEHGTLGYHYHATLEYPYTIGCYKGNPEDSNFTSGQGMEGGPPLPDGERRRPPEGERRGPPPDGNGRPNNGPPDLSTIASKLGISVEKLREALGPPPPDFAKTAEILGMPEEKLIKIFQESR